MVNGVSFELRAKGRERWPWLSHLFSLSLNTPFVKHRNWDPSWGCLKDWMEKKSKDEKSACTLFGQWLRGKEPACHAGDSGDMGSIPYQGVGKSQEFLPGKSHGQRSLEGYSPWGHKELDMTEHELLNGVWHTVGINKGQLSCCSYGEELNWRESEQTATTVF